MFGREDNTYDELRENSIEQWFKDIDRHDDILVRGGVKVTRDYIADLKKKITMLENKNLTKDRYLKKLRSEKIVEGKDI